MPGLASSLPRIEVHIYHIWNFIYTIYLFIFSYRQIVGFSSAPGPWRRTSGVPGPGSPFRHLALLLAPLFSCGRHSKEHSRVMCQTAPFESVTASPESPIWDTIAWSAVIVQFPCLKNVLLARVSSHFSTWQARASVADEGGRH